MPIITIDVETLKNENGKIIPVLDATGKYLALGCILRDTGGSETFYDKKEIWKGILKEGEKAFKRGKKLHVYGHSMRYDWYNIADIKDKNIKWFSENPFIVSYMKEVKKEFNDLESLKKWMYYAKIEHIRYDMKQIGKKYIITYKKEMIKFGDSMSLYRMSLKKMGEIIGHKKMEMPMEFKGKYITKGELKELEKYCINDCKIVMEGVKKIKKKLKEDGVNVRNLCTINQIAINYVMNELKKTNAENILTKDKKGNFTKWTYKTKFADKIHQAYRASLNRVWDVGVFNNVCFSDKNSLYPMCLIDMKFPNLRTERKIEKPGWNIIDEIGISKVMLKNKNDKIGLIPIRAIEKTYVPLDGKYIIGIYTNIEILEAIKNGYELLDIEWSIIYDECENPLKNIYLELYRKRMEGGDEGGGENSTTSSFNKFFYKAIMNSSIGKFAQRKVNQELCIDSIENIEKYLKLNGEVLRGINNSQDVLYKVKYDNYVKPYYAPIISCLVTAQARIYMYKIFKKIGEKELLYSDNDSLITRSNHLRYIKLGTGINDWKIEKDIETGEELTNAKAIIWGSKAKSVGNNITVAGAFKNDLTMDEFIKGNVMSKKQMGIKNVLNKEVGEFIIEQRDLNEQKKNFLKTKKLLDKELIYIDKDTKDISYFLPIINKIIHGNTILQESSKV